MITCPFKAPIVSRLKFGERWVSGTRFEQQDGLTLSTFALETGGEEAFQVWPFSAFSQIIFLLEGEMGLKIPGIGSRGLETGEWSVLSVNGVDISGTFSGAVRMVVVECSVEIWQEITRPEEMGSHLQKACIGCAQRTKPFFLKSRLNFAMDRLCRELLGTSGERASERLLIQARTLELLSVVTTSTPLETGGAVDPCLREYDHDALRAAAAFLEENLAENHSIVRLSRQVALNEFKLKKGFRERFGLTVFGYLRQKRMERAQVLLRSRKYTVLEVANTVGYSNPSHFSRAFRETFGINPREFLGSG